MWSSAAVKGATSSSGNGPYRRQLWPTRPSQPRQRHKARRSLGTQGDPARHQDVPNCRAQPRRLLLPCGQSPASWGSARTTRPPKTRGNGCSPSLANTCESRDCAARAVTQRGTPGDATHDGFVQHPRARHNHQKCQAPIGTTVAPLREPRPDLSSRNRNRNVEDEGNHPNRFGPHFAGRDRRQRTRRAIEPKTGADLVVAGTGFEPV